MFLNVTHHEVLDCTAAAAFQKLHLGDACETDYGTAASFIIIISLFTLVFFGLLCYVMLATSSSFSLTPLTYHAGQNNYTIFSQNVELCNVTAKNNYENVKLCSVTVLSFM